MQYCVDNLIIVLDDMLMDLDERTYNAVKESSSKVR